MLSCLLGRHSPRVASGGVKRLAKGELDYSPFLIRKVQVIAQRSSYCLRMCSIWGRMAASGVSAGVSFNPLSLPLPSTQRFFNSAPSHMSWKEDKRWELHYGKWHLFTVREYHRENAGILWLLNWTHLLTTFRNHKDRHGIFCPAPFSARLWKTRMAWLPAMLP